MVPDCGGLNLIQKFAIDIGFWLIFITILLSISVVHAMKEDYGDKTKEEMIEMFQNGKAERKEMKDE